MRHGASGAIHRGGFRRHCANFGKADVAQHAVQRGQVRGPPVRWIAVQLAAGVERHCRPVDANEIDDGLEDEELASDRRNALEREQRMAQVIKDAEKEHDVELADAVGERSITSMSTSSTFEPSARLASSNPAFEPQPGPCQEK